MMEQIHPEHFENDDPYICWKCGSIIKPEHIDRSFPMIEESGSIRYSCYCEFCRVYWKCDVKSANYTLTNGIMHYYERNSSNTS